MDIYIKDSLFDPESIIKRDRNNIEEKLIGNIYYYKVWIYITGKDIVYVDNVRYTLHSSFGDNERIRIYDRKPSNQYCKFFIETFGVFDINVEIKLKNGRLLKKSHRLSYDRELEEFGLLKN